MGTNDFLVKTLNLDKKRREEVDATYTFTFTPTNEIPDDGTIVLTLPTEYNLIASFPKVEITYPELSDESLTNKITHTYSANVLTINNLGSHPAKVPFRIIIKGVRNPAVGSLLTGFSIKTQLNGNDINVATNFLSITLDSVFTPGTLLSNYIKAFPTNNGVFADYTFNFTP